MNKQENKLLWPGFVLAVSLFAASLTSFFTVSREQRIYFHLLGEVCEKILEVQPEAEDIIAQALKAYRENPGKQAANTDNTTFIAAYGYQADDFFPLSAGNGIQYAFVGFLTGSAVFLFMLRYVRRRQDKWINYLTAYLEKVNAGDSGLLFAVGEDSFSKLQDELYKTVTELWQTREEALKARNHFAENLSMIAHQLKTPITSISLSLQMINTDSRVRQIQQQIDRLFRLENALLVLSRIDAGTLELERKNVDVFTLLTLAADNLWELFAEAGVSADIPEQEEMLIYADLDWTMEAIMNLWKNCMEHTPPGETVHCAYEQNPLYTQIRIWDTGTGFAEEDLPYLFERFYRGKEGKSNGIGIGLAIAKAIIESQNGTIRALNLSGGGACFEVRFYHSIPYRTKSGPVPQEQEFTSARKGILFAKPANQRRRSIFHKKSP